MKKLLQEKQNIFVIWIVEGIVHPPRRVGRQFVYQLSTGINIIRFCGRYKEVEKIEDGFAVRKFAHIGSPGTFVESIKR